MAILGQYEITEETFRQKFRAHLWKMDDRAQLVAAELSSLATQWLAPNTEVVEKVVGEQLLAIVPQEMRVWAQRSPPADLKALIGLLENFVAADPGVRQQEVTRPVGPARKAEDSICSPTTGGGSEPFRETVLRFAHEHTWAGHQGPAKTLSRILDGFFWPMVQPAVKAFCRSCPVCQKLSNRTPPRAPLEPLPIIERPFQRIAMDFVGPRPRTMWGCRFLLIIVDYATQFPKAILLKSMQAPTVA